MRPDHQQKIQAGMSGIKRHWNLLAVCLVDTMQMELWSLIQIKAKFVLLCVLKWCFRIEA